MVAIVRLGGDGQVLGKAQGAREVIFHMRGDHAARALDRHADDAAGGIFDLAHGLDGVVDGVAEEGIDIRRLHELQAAAVDDAVELDALFLTEKGLFGDEDIQRLVARLYGAVVDVDGAAELFHLVFFDVHLFAEGADHLFQVVALDVDEVDGLLRGLHLRLLQVQKVLGHARFLPHAVALQHGVQQAEDDEGGDEIEAGKQRVHGQAAVFAVHFKQLLEEHAHHQHRPAQRQNGR